MGWALIKINSLLYFQTGRFPIKIATMLINFLTVKGSNLTCLLAPAFTMAMIIFSDAINGSSWAMCFSIT